MVLERLERSSKKTAGRPSFKPAEGRRKKLVEIKITDWEHPSVAGTECCHLHVMGVTTVLHPSQGYLTIITSIIYYCTVSIYSED